MDLLRVGLVVCCCYCNCWSVCVCDPCSTTTYVFGASWAAPNRDRGVFVHRIGFPGRSFKERDFEAGADCLCASISCYRRRSEFCVENGTNDDPDTQTWKSYTNMNPSTKHLGAVFVIDDTHFGFFERFGLMVRTCYPYVSVVCAFWQRSSAAFPWMAECCDALVFSARKLTIGEEFVLYEEVSSDHDGRGGEGSQLVIFTLAPYRFSCGKCGLSTRLNVSNFLHDPALYKRRQRSPAAKELSIVVRSREAYLTLENLAEPMRVRVTGGFEGALVEHIAAALNFTFIFIGNVSTLTTGGGINTNGTFDGMLDLLLKRTAVVSFSNQKPIHPGDELFTFSKCYDVDSLSFASRAELYPVTMEALVRSIGRKPTYLLTLSIVAMSVIVSLLLLPLPRDTPRRRRLVQLLSLFWYFTCRLFNPGVRLSLLSPSTARSEQLKWILNSWAYLALILSSLFSGLWVAFLATPPLLGVIDSFFDLMKLVVERNSTCFMSPGMVKAGYVYENAGPIFEHGVGTDDAKLIISSLQSTKHRSFWLHEKLFVMFQLNRYDPQARVHISGESFAIQPQCWVFQKNCALEASISHFLGYYAESGLFTALKDRFNVSRPLRTRKVEAFKPLKVQQVYELFTFVFVVPSMCCFVLLGEVLVVEVRRWHKRVTSSRFDRLC